MARELAIARAALHNVWRLAEDLEVAKTVREVRGFASFFQIYAEMGDTWLKEVLREARYELLKIRAETKRRDMRTLETGRKCEKTRE